MQAGYKSKFRVWIEKDTCFQHTAHLLYGPLFHIVFQMKMWGHSPGELNFSQFSLMQGWNIIVPGCSFIFLFHLFFLSWLWPVEESKENASASQEARTPSLSKEAWNLKWNTLVTENAPHFTYIPVIHLRYNKMLWKLVNGLEKPWASRSFSLK